jgi:predicted AAA+ superfamily ATPase
MHMDSLLQIVGEWIEEATLPKLIPRKIDPVNPERLRDILAIVGPRRAGKTFLMYQLIRALLETGRWTRKDILFVDWEDYRLKGFRIEEVDSLFVAFNQLAGQYPTFLFFDEVQYLPEWSRVLRTLHNRGRYRIIISGSNSKLLEREVATELRGRYTDFLLLPFGFPEFLQFRQIPFTPAVLHTSARGRILRAFDEYLRDGGFPEVLTRETTTERRKLLQTYYNTIFYRDILERFNIKAKAILDGMMTYVVNTPSELFSISSFEKQLRSRSIPGSKRTIANYLRYLEDAFFVIANEKFSYSSRQRLMNPKRVYLADTGFLMLGTPFSENRGQILENAVAIELFRRGHEMFYFKGRHECDFVLKEGTRPREAIQVCWELRPQNEKREIQGLMEAMATLKLHKGTILAYAQEEMRKVGGQTISIYPVWKWLLGQGGAGKS